jgi:hypothetical protein
MILFTVVTKQFVRDGASKFQTFRANFHKFHSVFSTRLTQLGHAIAKFWARWVPKMFTGAQKTQRTASALTFFERYHKDDDEFLNHVVRLRGGETWVSFVNAEIEEQSKQ